MAQLSSIVVNNNMFECLEVAPPSKSNLYFVILDMNGLLSKKKPLELDCKRVYSFEGVVVQFLEFYMKSFEVVFWSSCNKRNLKAMLHALKNVYNRKYMEGVHKYQLFDQDWWNRICNSHGALILESSHFFEGHQCLSQ